MAEMKWKEYNKSLVKRGELWISRDILQKIQNKYKSIFYKIYTNFKIYVQFAISTNGGFYT